MNFSLANKASHDVRIYLSIHIYNEFVHVCVHKSVSQSVSQSVKQSVRQSINLLTHKRTNECMID